MAVARPLGQHWTFGQQVVQPIVPAAAPAATSNWAFLPLGLLCLLLGLLAIAATIVLSLIPTFTHSVGVTPQSTSRPFDTTFLTGNGTLQPGPLSASDRAALQAALNSYLARDARFAGCTVNLNSANVQDCPSTRRMLQKRGRRRRRQQQQHQRQSSQKRLARQASGSCVNQQILTTSTLTCARCFGSCLRQKANLLQTLLPNFLATVSFPAAGQTVTVAGTNEPLPPTTTTTAGTAATGTTTTGSGGAGGAGGSNTASTPANTASTSGATASTSATTANTGSTTVSTAPTASSSGPTPVSTAPTASSSEPTPVSTAPTASSSEPTTTTTTPFMATSAMMAG